ncbi:MAG TPA: hypothetical protein VG675_02005 [Bryobacteraceae bacterium]|nr:hypothetical protein [Bryobacteraceae bacterium]
MATICTGMAYASGPIAVYALVDKVAFEPGSGKPERIRISGVFITAERTPDNSIAYSAPQRGYFYFELPKSHEELALREWADLKSVAGTRQVVGFGSAWYSQLHVKKPDEEAKAPVAYPLGNGMIKVNPDQPRASALLNYKGR